jgi:hypothetical protein
MINENYIGDAVMIRDPNRWPGETLCLKKRPKEGEKTGVMGYSAYGVITTPDLPITIYLRPDFIAAVKYNSVEELLAAGWLVD